MKASITKQGHLWRLVYHIPDSNHGLCAKCFNFHFYEGALNWWLRVEKQVTREIKAWNLLRSISLQLCEVQESKLIHGLMKTACHNISKRQYGWLKGIYERQQL